MDGHDQSDLNAVFENAASGDNRRIGIDTAKYQAYLDDPALSPAQKQEIIEALWSIVVSFVELGFRVDPTSLACGQVESELDPAGPVESDNDSAGKSDCKVRINNNPARE